MFKICIDENNFYKEGIEGTLVEVSDIPIGVDLTTYKYNHDTKALEPPEEKAGQES